MSRKRRFLTLTPEQEAAVLAGYTSGKSSTFRKRCQAVLLSHRGKSIKELCDIFDVLPNSITNWLNRWEKEGVRGLQTVVGQGRPCKIKADDAPLIAVIKAKVEASPKKLDTVLAQLERDSSLSMSRRTLKRFLKKTVTGGSVSDAI